MTLAKRHGGTFSIGAVTGFAVRAAALFCVAAPLVGVSAFSANAETRTLKLYFMHTGEKAEITFKKDGRYIDSGLRQANRFLRDWRKHESTKMDPQLLDLIWQAYQASGSRSYIHVVCGYRSPATNEMLRRTRGGQAKKSQHMLGKAMDFYIPGVNLEKLREIGFKLQGGGVGYYPKSGSPFVHFDTGSVRAWPRMSRSQLVKIFPDGKTLHLPPDGQPLAGYQQALADYKSRKSRGLATVADARGGGRSIGSSGGTTLLAALFSNGGADEEEDNVQASSETRRAPASTAKPDQRDTGKSDTLLAALTSRDAPRAAPRPAASVPSSPQPQTQVAKAAPEAPSPLDPNSIPLPSRKPAVLLARTNDAATASDATPPMQVASAEPASDRFGLSTSNIPLPLHAPRATAETKSASDELVQLAAMPTRRPDAGSPADDDNGAIAMAAYAPPERETNQAVMAFPARALAPADRSAAKQKDDGEQRRSTRLTGKAPVTADYDTGVFTTAKSGRVKDAVEQAGSGSDQVIPADEINPARFGSWTTASVSITDEGRTQARPHFIQNALREAPAQVYTAGFSKDQVPDPRRFSGNAVTFLAVAKFDDGGSRGAGGQPLTLDLPSRN